MPERRRIRTPLKRWWQLFRVRCMPVVLWLAAVAGVVVLWRERSTRVDAPGMIEARQANVASVQHGTLMELPVELFDEVKAGQILVRMDDSAVRAALEVAAAEKQRLEAELLATERQLKHDAELREQDAFSRTRNYAVRTEQLRIEKLDKMIQLENDEVEGQRLGSALERLRTLRAGNVIGDQEYDDIRYQHEAVQKRIAATKEALSIIEGRLREAMAREEFPESRAAIQSIDVALAPFRQAVAVQVKRLEETQVQREALVLRSPFDGVVTAILHREGEAVVRGNPILTVADPSSMRIVSFIEQGKPIEPTPGMRVEVRRRTRPMQVAESHVRKVSPQVEPIPPAVLGSPTVIRWGVRVLIDVPTSLVVPQQEAPPGPLRPGELLDVRYFVPGRGGGRRSDWRELTPTS